jgi:hypothetical protein
MWQVSRHETRSPQCLRQQWKLLVCLALPVKSRRTLSTSFDSDAEMRTTIAWLALWVPISWIWMRSCLRPQEIKRFWRERFEMDKMKLIISTGKLLGSNPLQSSWM